MDPMTMSSAILGFAGVVITGLCKWRPRGTNGFMPKDQCDDRFKYVCEGIKRIEHMQGEMFKEIKELRK